MTTDQVKSAVESIIELLSRLSDQETFAKQFAEYVAICYTLEPDGLYHMKAEGLQHVSRNIHDVLNNFYYVTQQARFLTDPDHDRSSECICTTTCRKIINAKCKNI